VLLFFGRAKRNERYLLIVRCETQNAEAVERLIATYFQARARIRVTNTTRSSSEYIYEIAEKVMRDSSERNGKPVTEALYTIDGVETVNIVCQNDEISR